MFAGEQAGDTFGEEPGRGDVDGDAPAVGDARQAGFEVGGQGDVDGVGRSQQFQCALGEGRVGESDCREGPVVGIQRIESPAGDCSVGARPEVLSASVE